MNRLILSVFVLVLNNLIMAMDVDEGPRRLKREETSSEMDKTDDQNSNEQSQARENEISSAEGDRTDCNERKGCECPPYNKICLQKYHKTCKTNEDCPCPKICCLAKGQKRSVCINCRKHKRNRLIILRPHVNNEDDEASSNIDKSEKKPSNHQIESNRVEHGVNREKTIEEQDEEDTRRTEKKLLESKAVAKTLSAKNTEKIKQAIETDPKDAGISSNSGEGASTSETKKSPKAQPFKSGQKDSKKEDIDLSENVGPMSADSKLDFGANIANPNEVVAYVEGQDVDDDFTAG